VPEPWTTLKMNIAVDMAIDTTEVRKESIKTRIIKMFMTDNARINFTKTIKISFIIFGNIPSSPIFRCDIW
jgi:hypothetical protein